MEKIAVVGVSCSGKTTFGKNLSILIDITPVDIDDIHWKPNWESTPTNELLPKVKEALSCPRWVVSGNYTSLQEYIFSEADTIIWLDYSPLIVASRAMRRTLRRSLFKEPCCNGNYESMRRSFFSRESILLWVFKTYRRRKTQYRNLFSNPNYQGKKLIRFRSPKEVKSFFSALS